RPCPPLGRPPSPPTLAILRGRTRQPLSIVLGGGSMSQSRATIVLATVERCRKRLWGHCYRMTGRRTDADDLSQEAIARAIERADDLRGTSPEAWLFPIATTACLGPLRP